jgi:hypothetical protein
MNILEIINIINKIL